MKQKSIARHAYLVRCWLESQSTPDGKPLWRFSVEEVLHARRRWGFDDLARLMVFLRDELARDAEDGEFKICDSKFSKEEKERETNVKSKI